MTRRTNIPFIQIKAQSEILLNPVRFSLWNYEKNKLLWGKAAICTSFAFIVRCWRYGKRKQLKYNKSRQTYSQTYNSKAKLFNEKKHACIRCKLWLWLVGWQALDSWLLRLFKDPSKSHTGIPVFVGRRIKGPIGNQRSFHGGLTHWLFTYSQNTLNSTYVTVFFF